MDSDSDNAEVPEPSKVQEHGVNEDDSEGEVDDEEPPKKKTKKESKAEDRGKKESSVSFKTEGPRGGSHRINACPTRGEKYKASPN